MDNSHHKHQLVSVTKRFILESTIALKSKAHTEAVFQCACHLQDSCSPVVQAHSPDWNRAIFFPQPPAACKGQCFEAGGKHPCQHPPLASQVARELCHGKSVKQSCCHRAAATTLPTQKPNHCPYCVKILTSFDTLQITSGPLSPVEKEPLHYEADYVDCTSVSNITIEHPCI